MSQASSANQIHNPESPPLPAQEGERLQWGRLYGISDALTIATAAREFPGMILVIASSVQAATELENGIGFFLEGDEIPILGFPDQETLPYDIFPPLPEIVSERLRTLYQLPQTRRGILIVPITTLMQRLPPRSYVESGSFLYQPGDRLPLEETRRQLEQNGYRCVSQVLAHGEFAVRGSILDLYPMGTQRPLRIDLFDDEIESIRTFDPETQRSLEKIETVEILPAREFPTDQDAISRFRRAFRDAFEDDPGSSLIYREISDGNVPGGVEYYLPLFFEQTGTLFDYLPDDHLTIWHADVRDRAEEFLDQVEERFQQRRHDSERPILPPLDIYLGSDELANRLKTGRSIQIRQTEIESRHKGFRSCHNFNTKALPPLGFQSRTARPAQLLQSFLQSTPGHVLFVAESAGRREMLHQTLLEYGIKTEQVKNWGEFMELRPELAITVHPLEQGLWLPASEVVVISETQLLGEVVRQERRRKAKFGDSDQVIRNLTELHLGAPAVHEDHGVGRYMGLQTLEVGGTETEFLTLEYAKGDRLYVPVSSLHLISRYSGASPEHAPLHRLGGDQWEKAKRKAAEKVRDVAAELLEIYARRAANPGHSFPRPGDEYASFASNFEFEETPDQQQAIDSVLADMESPQHMERVVCGDVGFGKTEVAMRAAFSAVQGNRQVAILAPTTLLVQQHYQNFSDRFADWPVKVESLSRFRTTKQQQQVLDGLSEGTIDIVVGTHKLLQKDVVFKQLGLVIIDEEHRFGVRHKERLKALRSEVDILTLTATPIPRTLNMALTGLYDLSIIATPPVARHPIKTFVCQWNDALIIEACQREIKRGGQVYFLHNEVSTIENMAQKLEELMPGVRLQVAHGQMRERELEGIMRDFYHQRFNILLCTTIIESGIDVPNANTILMNRADKLGLAQLHQLRGRVGRSHHRAYAYLLTPPPRSMTQDARKRLEAIESMEDLGAGFTLATHDLEIRGAGELLGEGQSGQIHEIGYTLYTELLERTVNALKSGQQPDLERPLDHGAEVDLQLPALIPEDYIPDVHTRLVLYKRIASCSAKDELREIQVELIDRFGLLPQQVGFLFGVTRLKLQANPMGIRKIEAGPSGGRIIFNGEPRLDPSHLIMLIQTRPKEYKLDGGDKIKFFRDMPDREKRIDQVASILNEISSR